MIENKSKGEVNNTQHTSAYALRWPLYAFMITFIFIFILSFSSGVIVNQDTGTTGGVTNVYICNGTLNCTGPQGPAGANGVDGVNGTNGVDGVNGTFSGILNQTQFINDSTTYSINQTWLTSFIQVIVTAYNYITAGDVPTIMGNSTIARIGDCPAGQVVQNTTTGGVQCVAMSSVTLTNVAFTNESNNFIKDQTINNTINYFNSSTYIKGDGRCLILMTSTVNTTLC